MEKLFESIGKIVKAIISSEFFWLIVAAVAAFSLAFMLVEKDPKAYIIGDADSLIKIKAVYVFAIAVALLLVKVVTWLAQQEKLIEILGKIIQGVFSAQTFWLIVVALAIFGGVAAIPNIGIIPEDPFRVILPCPREQPDCENPPCLELPWPEPKVIALGAVALLLAKVVVWVVRRVVDQYFT